MALFGRLVTTLMKFANVGADTNHVLELVTEGANGATVKVFVGNRTPVGNVTGSPGTYYARVSAGSSTLYVHQGAVADNTSWADIAATGSGDASGPASSDDEALARFDQLTGKLLQNGPIKESDTGEFRDWLYKAISPAAIAAQQDDYTPTDWTNADVVRLSATGGDQYISGFAAITANAGVPRKILINVGATDALLILNNDGTSAAGNRVLTPGDDGFEFRLDPGEVAILTYDYTAAAWRVEARDSRVHVTDFRSITEATAGTYNDYNAAGWGKADILFYNDPTESGDVYFTGFEAGVVQKRKHIINLRGGPIHLLHQDTGSVVGNRLLCPRGANVVLERYEAALLVYTGSDWSVAAVSEQEVLLSVTNSFVAQRDDYSPPNWATLDLLNADPTGGAQSITGFERIFSHQFKIIVNLSGADHPLTLANENAASAINNRIRTPDERDLVLQKGDVAVIAYDDSILRWRVVSPTQPDTVNAITDALGANQNNYSPVGWNHADLLRLTMAANRTITGFARLNSHNHKLIVNEGAGTLSLTHQDGASAAGNQIRTPNAATLAVPAGYAVELAYDSTTLYWYVIAAAHVAQAAGLRETGGPTDLAMGAVADVTFFKRSGTTVVGVAAASTTEALTGTDTAKPITPDALAALWEKGTNVASAATVSLGEGGFFHITGTTTITDIDFATAKDGRHAFIVFDGVLTLTHNGTTLQLPGGANIVTAAGDRACFVQDSGDNIICLWYQRAATTPSASASTTEVLTGTDASKFVTPDALTALWEKGANVASAANVSLGEGGLFHITGTTTITDIDFDTPKDGRTAIVVFDAALTLTHNGTTLQLPGGANIVTAAGDRAVFVQDSGDNIICVLYQRASTVTTDAAPDTLLWGADNVTASTTTRYLYPGFDDSTAQTSTVQIRVPRAGTIRKLRARHETGAGNGNAIVYTLRKNGVATALTASLASTANDASDLTNSATVAAGDLIDIEVTKAVAVGTSPSDITVTAEFAGI